MEIDFKALHEARLARNPPQLRSITLSSGLKVQYYTHPGLEIGSVLWEGGLILSEYLLQNPHLTFQKRIIELGSGLGISGIVASQSAATVHLTDKPDLIPLLTRNIALNSCQNASASAYIWGQTPAFPLTPPYDLVLGADLLYQEENYDALVAALEAITEPNSLVLMTWKDRGLGENRFMAKLRYTVVDRRNRESVSIVLMRVG